jgi:hypothetical protein
MWPVITAVCIGVAVTVWSIGEVRKGPKQESPTVEVQLARWGIPIVLLILYGVTVSGIVLIPYQDFNVSRLIPSLELLRGHEPYSLPNEGPIFCNLYGPVSLMVFLPAGLATTPNGSIVIGGIINSAFAFLPFLALHMRYRRNTPDGRVWALVGFAFAVGALLGSRGGYDICIATHADAPAVGLGLLSCMAVMNGDDTRGWSRPALAASAAVLSVWTKQVEVPVIAALMIYVACAYGKESFYRLVICLIIAGGISVVVFIGAFGFENLWMNLMVIPSRHPWWHTGAYVLIWILFDMARIAWPFALIVTVGAVTAVRSASRVKRSLGAFLREEPWILLVLAAILMIPTSVVGRAKVGSWESAYHSLYYLIAAASLVLVRLTDPSYSGGLSRLFSRIALAATVAAVALCSPCLTNLPLLLKMDLSPQQQAYKVALEKPGEVYFPWNPVSMLLAEGKLYNTEPGLLDLKWAGLMPSKEEFMLHVPPNMKYVAYQKDRPHEVAMELLPEFGRTVHLPELPGWIVYARK